MLCRDFFDVRDIFDIFFGPSVARVEKYVENVENVENVETKHEKNEASQPNFVCKQNPNQRYIGYFVYLSVIFCTANGFKILLANST